MKLSHIIEDRLTETKAIKKAIDNVKAQATNSSFIRAAGHNSQTLFYFLMNTITQTTDHLIYEEEDWWERLFSFVPSIDPKLLQQVKDETSRTIEKKIFRFQKMQEASKKASPQQGTVKEGFSEGFAFFIKAIVALSSIVIKALASHASGVRPNSDYAGDSSSADDFSADGFDARDYTSQIHFKAYMNANTITDFLVRVESKI